MIDDFYDILYCALKDITDWIKEFGMNEPFLVVVRRSLLMICSWIEKDG